MCFVSATRQSYDTVILIVAHVMLMARADLDFFSFCCVAIREDGMPGGRNKSIGPVQVNHVLYVQ